MEGEGGDHKTTFPAAISLPSFFPPSPANIIVFMFDWRVTLWYVHLSLLATRWVWGPVNTGINDGDGPHLHWTGGSEELQ